MAIDSVVDRQGCAHLRPCRQHTESNYRDGPVREVVVRQSRPQRAKESQRCSDGVCREAHLWLADAMIPLCEVVGDGVCQWTAEISANEGANERREEDETLSIRIE